jgi:hypothetical protein
MKLSFWEGEKPLGDDSEPRVPAPRAPVRPRAAPVRPPHGPTAGASPVCHEGLET